LGVPLIQWGFKDPSALYPLNRYTVEAFEQEIFNIQYHMKMPRSEVLSWPLTERRRNWAMLVEQRKFEKNQTERPE